MIVIKDVRHGSMYPPRAPHFRGEILSYSPFPIQACTFDVYTPYEGLNLANQNNRKLEVFGRKLEETFQNCIDILINISKNETILFN